jgi:hypothetical protein
VGRFPLSLAASLLGLGAVCGALWVSVPDASSLRPPRPAPRADGEERPIPPAPVERTLRSGAADIWWIDLRAGDYLGLGIDQHGLDVIAILRDPAGRPVLEIDTPTGRDGPEPLHAIARRSGRHRIEIRPLEAGGAGRYGLRIEARRPATSQDRARAAAVAAFSRAERRWSAGDAASLQAALAEYHASLRGWRRTGALREEGIALWRIGQIAARQGRLREAAESFERSLAVARRLGDGAAEVRPRPA